MEPTELLKKEHEDIKLMLRVINKVNENITAGQEVNPAVLEEILEFIKVYADQCHHGKEEALLFPALVEAGMPKEGGPIKVMLVEHETGRNFVRGMTKAIAEYKAGDKKSLFSFYENAKGYIHLLNQHIDKENNILFKMASLQLSNTKKEELLKQFEKVDTEKIGSEKHKRLHQIVQRLAKEYSSRLK